MFGPEPLEPDPRLAAHTLAADKGRVGTGAAVLGLGGVTLSMSAACPGGQLTISEGADLSPDTRKQQGLDFPHGWRRVPLQAGRAPTTVDGDLQQQPVAQALNTLQHFLLGRCGCLVWPAGLNPPGRPPRRFPDRSLRSRSFMAAPFMACSPSAVPAAHRAEVPAPRGRASTPHGLAAAPVVDVPLDHQRVEDDPAPQVPRDAHAHPLAAFHRAGIRGARL